MQARTILIIILIILLLPFIALARTERALLIGLGEQKDPAWNKINGDRDVELLSRQLSEAGVRDIHTLVNQKATKKAIVSAIKALTARSKSGDLVYIHFSGHGQRMTDLDLDEKDDVWDEAWIPYDAYRKYCRHDQGEKHLSDDELALLFAKLADRLGQQGRLIVVADACHSGDSSRGEEDTCSVPVRGVMDDFVIPGTPRHTSETRPAVRWTLLSACKDYQLNYEHRQGFGLLTYTLCKLWAVLGEISDNKAMMRAITGHMRSEAVAGQRPQTPVLETNVSTALGPLFSIGK